MTSGETIDALKRELDGAYSADSTKIFPTFFATVPNIVLGQTRQRGTTIEDVAIACFHNLGLRCDRTRKNLYGYPGLFRDLNTPPPWIEVTPEDVDGPLTTEREKELQPLYLWIDRCDNDQLYGFFRGQSEERTDALHRLGVGPMLGVVNEFTFATFAETVELARCLGTEKFYELLDCVFEPYDEFTTAVGAPDLFVWSQEHDLWFFAEVKGPGDSLQQSQVAWLNHNWNTIEGRFVLVVLHEDA